MQKAIFIAVLCLAASAWSASVLDGTWMGREEGRRVEGEFTALFEDPDFVTKGPHLSDSQKGTFTLNADAKPFPTVDLTWTTGPFAGNKSLSIFEVYQNTLLRIAVGRPGNAERPDNFIPRPDAEDRLFDLLKQNGTRPLIF